MIDNGTHGCILNLRKSWGKRKPEASDSVCIIIDYIGGYITAVRQRIRRSIIIVSMLTFPVTLYFLSPVLFLGGLARGILTGSVLFFGLQFISALMLGRAYCGWLCPAAGITETLFIVNSKPVPRAHWVKYLIWGPWFGFGIFLVIKAIIRGTVWKIDPLYMTAGGISVYDLQGYIVFFGVLAVIIIVSLATGKRGFCHYTCWMAPFMIFGRKLRNLLRLPSLRLKARTDECISCSRCSKECPMSIDVQTLVQRSYMEHDDCTLCGMCVDTCKQSVISYSFRGGK